MKKITSNLQPGTQGDSVADLQDALLFLIERNVIKTSLPPNRPTADELETLTTRLKQERLESTFRDATQQVVRYFQNQQGLGDHLAGIVEQKTAGAINKLLRELGALAPAVSFRVSGRVYSTDRAGVGDLQVRAVDKNAGPDVVLAEGKTDDAGRYTLSYSTEALSKAAPDLQVRIATGDTFLGASDVRYNATPSETLDVVLPAKTSVALLSEHATLIGSIAAHYAGRLKDLQESDDRSDVTYLANKTGWDARAVVLAALADQFSARTVPESGGAPAIAPEFFYALFRAGLPANDADIYRADAKTVAAIWSRAAGQGVIPQSLVSAIPAAAAAFEHLSAGQLLTAPAPVGVSSLTQLLTSSRLTTTQQELFARLYVANGGDSSAFWQAAADAFGADVVKGLQLDGKLAFLTRNNAPLIEALRGVVGPEGLTDPIELAHAGYHRAAKWRELLTAGIPVPSEIPGDTADAKRANYADILAAQIRVSYPTAAVAEMVKSGDLPVKTPDQVQGFLTEHQGRFEISAQPVEQFVAQNNIQAAPETVAEVKRLQRVYQITPSDQAMAGLLKQGIDTAYQIVRFDKTTFVQRFSQDIGGFDQAALVYDKSLQVHNFTLNIAASYLTARNGITLGAPSLLVSGQDARVGGEVLRPAPLDAAGAAGVIAYPTLETLFGSMDFCSCDHCRSILSPAAYLVDLLHFIDREPTADEASAGVKNPQAILLGRRPDIQHLPLTCENTNTALPYIDLVNETLEYFVANNVQPLSLNEFAGHDTKGIAAEDLLASPQFVMEAAYTTLGAQRFPPPLPFNRALETLRRVFQAFDISLPVAMEHLRKNDDMERGTNPYGWRDILMEDLGLSREEHEILTDSAAVPLWRMYGFSQGTADAAVVAELSNAKTFSRRLSLSYEEVVALLQTHFINPNSDLIPKLNRLGVPFATLKAFHDGTIAHLPVPAGAGAPDPREYGGDIEAWVKDPANFARMMAIVTLSSPGGDSSSCDFDALEFRYSRPAAGPADTSNRIGGVEFVRLLRFVRLWRNTRWTIEQTDAAVCALYRPDLGSLTPDNIDTLGELDAGFATLLPRLGIVVRAMRPLGLRPARDLLPLLTCWSDIGTRGDRSLYRQMFLNVAILDRDAAFGDDGYGNFLRDPNRKLLEHADTLRSAFNLTAEEFGRIVTALAYDANTPLTLSTISAIFRRGWLARVLRLSVRELLLLISLTGLDPFALSDPTRPAILRLIALVQAMRNRSLKPAAALYLIWNQDITGKAAPDASRVLELARTLRGDFAATEDEFAVTEDPGGDVARARMVLVYGQDASDAFFALLDDSITLDVLYTHATPVLEAGITAVDPAVAYDPFRHRLSHKGLLGTAKRDALKAIAGVSVAFQTAVDALFAASADASGSFFGRYPELKPLYDTYTASTDPVEKKRAALLAAFSPELAKRRKRQQAVQRLADAASVGVGFVQTLLDALMPPYPLHAAGEDDRPALDDVIALESRGLAAQFFFRDAPAGAPDLTLPGPATLDYSPDRDRLPSNPTAGAPISGVWQGRLEIAEPGYYNLVIDTDAGATVSLTFDGRPMALAQNGSIWRNADVLELKGGTLYDIAVTVAKVTNLVSLKWETPTRSRELIPGRYLYPPAIVGRFSDVYVRLLKSASLAASLRLTTREMAHFAIHPDYRIANDGWLNTVPVSGTPTASIAGGLFTAFEALLDLSRIKSDLSVDSEGLLDILEDPAAATASADSALFALAHWEPASLSRVLAQFGETIASLGRFHVFRRVHDAFGVVRPMGVSAATLIAATTNAPTTATVNDLHDALRARYAAADWLALLRPINDAMRALQRDALVAYILHQMRGNPDTAHIDTPDKLFEYFLMDVQMEPCMLTSRIRHALSSVQLFIERCLMNLEQPSVSPASLDAGQWTWMNRYRFWEAERKVFLWPENWLEPELRDDKSSFFKELESDLLQSDITDDAASTAVVNYLAKLEDVAKLEPCGIYHLEPTDRRGAVIHVVARTAGARRKYFYRRYEFGYWIPWEQIKLDIEDNPIVPVVWNDRLLLFWLRLLTKAPDATRPPAGKPLGELTTSDLPSPGEMTRDAVLCWSEYYNGKWQAAKTSDVARPTTLPAFAAFNDRSRLRLGTRPEGDALRVHITDGPTRSFVTGSDGLLDLVETWPGSFLFYNTHSIPVRGEDVVKPAGPGKQFLKSRDFAGTATELAFAYSQPPAPPLTRHILEPQMAFTVVTPRHELWNAWDAPFLYSDSRHAFFVTSEAHAVRLPTFDGYGILPTVGERTLAKIPPLVVQSPPPPKPQVWGERGVAAPGRGVADPMPLRAFVSEDAYIRQGLPTTVNVDFGDCQIGPSGVIPLEKPR